MKNNHIELQKPEELRSAETDKSLNLPVLSEERSNTFLPVNDSMSRLTRKVTKRFGT